MIHLDENAYVIFEYHSERSDREPELILYQYRFGALHNVIDPRETDEEDSVITYLEQNKIKFVYTPIEILPMPDELLGLKLKFENEYEIGSYQPVNAQFWINKLTAINTAVRKFEILDESIEEE